MVPLFRPAAALDRRTFLVAGGLSFLGAGFAGQNAVAAASPGRKIAKSAIMIWLSGGASHIDTWDMTLHFAQHNLW